MSQWSACKFMTIYHVSMCSIWIEWLCIPRWLFVLISLLHHLNRIVQSTKLTVHVRYDNQVMSPCTQKIENWNESTMLLFFQCTTYPKNWKLKWDCYFIIVFYPADRRLLFSSILSLVVYIFSHNFIFTPFFPSLPVPLGVILYAQPYVYTCASPCSPWGLVCVCPDV